mmetsp:Transcript_6914/g.21607  ORF Transcript_6914/g.21607 Transcript_6914/m.21607 type:complete len:294 (+) Transcript_6914:1162-2043(+)
MPYFVLQDESGHGTWRHCFCPASPPGRSRTSGAAAEADSAVQAAPCRGGVSATTVLWPSKAEAAEAGVAVLGVPAGISAAGGTAVLETAGTAPPVASPGPAAAARSPASPAACRLAVAASPSGSTKVLRHICTDVKALSAIVRYSRPLSAGLASSPEGSVLDVRRFVTDWRCRVRKLIRPCRTSCQRLNSRSAKSSWSSAASLSGASSSDRSTWKASSRLLCPRFLWIWCCKRMRASTDRSSRRSTARKSGASAQCSWESSLQRSPRAAMELTSECSKAPTSSRRPPWSSRPK